MQNLPTLPVLLLTIFLVACGGGGGSQTIEIPETTASAPGAPTIGTITEGDASASITFSAPTDNGGATISGYEATCTAGSDSQTATGTESPIAVTDLTNDTTYECSVTATNSAGTGVASATVSVTPTAGSSTTNSTAGVECMYSYAAFNDSPSVNKTSIADWICDDSRRILTANGIPNHDVGTFPNSHNPNTISEQSISEEFAIEPVLTTNSTELGGPRGITGYVLNGVKIDAGTAGSCNDSGSSCSLAPPAQGSWSIEALGQSSFNFGDDENHAHVQPGGAYHYHGIPEGFVDKLEKGTEMTLVAWAADGFPIYARYGYQDAMDASSAILIIESSYLLKSSPDANRPSISDYAMGAFTQDYEYVAGSGSNLDECNGRTGVTPEFPEGIYHYYATNGFPFLQRCVKGAL